jgi:glyoxylate reductase
VESYSESPGRSFTFEPSCAKGESVIGKVFVARPIFQETVELLQLETEVAANLEDRVLSKPELIEKLQNVDGVLSFTTDTVDREVIERSPRLKVIANFGVGYNNVDWNAATELGVIVTNTPGVLTETTADLAWSLLMTAARRVAEGDRLVRAGKFKMWGPKMLLGYDVFGKTLGLVGLGRIGQAVARRARGFDMKILFYNPRPVAGTILDQLGVESVSLEELYRRSDFISLHAPLLPETTHLLNDRAFTMMKRTCIVINSSRGPVVDEKALVRALKAGEIAGAALDVYEREPQIEPELLTMENVVLAPHIGSASHETRLKMAMMAADNLLSALKGLKPRNLVNPAVWDRRRP